MWYVKTGFSILLSITSLTVAMQEQLTITDMPKDVIRHISGFFENDSDRMALNSTCRYLNTAVTQANKIVTIMEHRQPRIKTEHWRPRLRSEGAKQFLANVFTCIQHIIARDGNNPIELYIGDFLACDANDISTFLAQCSEPRIAKYITLLWINNSKLTFLTKEIAGLTHLKELNLSRNDLEGKDLVLLEKIIHESLTKLEIVDLRSNDKITLHDVFQTIAHCKLKWIYTLFKDENRLYIPTEQELAECKAEHVIV